MVGVDKPRSAPPGANTRSCFAARLGPQNRRAAIRAPRVFQFVANAVGGGADQQMHVDGHGGGDIPAPDNKLRSAVRIDQFTSDVPRYAAAVPTYD